MVVCVCGSRSLAVDPSVVAALVRRAFPGASVLVSGGACGVDASVPAAAGLLGCRSVVLRPDYRLFGRRAPLVRDAAMVARSAAVVALWDGVSRGTVFTVAEARRRGLPLTVFRSQ